ncbi:MAG: bifunctional N-acetylglucosamine-1-phosphate uridyltransferase/glucosamine-1-phosphate acetyltransferase [Candidatus Omnitrophica bacterium]|nr:bifunctional N-acetylglucosamine-1-phosphate uridyltransferase/glucosamine-1-phosphate acetyltransferase [Candidatus Omnitrophota bacterium]
MQAIVLAAGMGKRMRSSRPKVLHEIFGRPILDYVLEILGRLGINRVKVVIGHGGDQVRSFLKKRSGTLRTEIVYQHEQKGTGHAVMCAQKAFRGYYGNILIWPGDMPVLKEETLKVFLQNHQSSGAEVSVLSSPQLNPAGYGRILRAGGRFYAIREELECSEVEHRIQEVNSGIYIFKSDRLFKSLRRIKPANRKNEFYLTDTLEVLAGAKCRLEAFPLALPDEGHGINSREDLGEVTAIMNHREIRKHQASGVTFTAPEQTFVAPGVSIGRDTVIYPWTYIESQVKIGEGCEIGPFAKIRKGTVIGSGTIVGSFVELNRSRLGKKVLAKHLTYLGDAEIGDGTNIGAGTITANFDGKTKHKTKVGKGVLIGSDTVFVAPVVVGDGARTGAGAVITGGSKIKKGEVFVGVPARNLKKKKTK